MSINGPADCEPAQQVRSEARKRRSRSTSCYAVGPILISHPVLQGAP